MPISISKRIIVSIVIQASVITLLSLNYRQRLNETRWPRIPRDRICVKFSDCDAKAGFPFPFMYGSDAYTSGSPVYTAALNGGPFALLGLLGEMNDDDKIHAFFDLQAFAFNLNFYIILVTLGRVIVSKLLD